MAKVLAISSHVVRGAVGLAATVPALQSLGHEVWALPTVLLSSRPGLGRLVKHDVPAAELANLRDGRFVRVAGLVLVRQRPGTAKGITFVTIEDETGVANLIIRMDVWERFYHVARTAAAYVASGRLQNQQGVIHVLVSRLENMNESLAELRSRSRDFQ